MEKRAQTKAEIIEILAKRWSSRAYDAERGVANEALVSIMEAARWAPSCFGEQPWRFIVCNRMTNPSAWENALSCLTERNQAWARHTPVLIHAIAKAHFSHNDKPNRWSQYDTGAAMFALVTQATTLGLMTRQMGGFDMEKSRATFGIPEGHTPMAFVAVGYAAPADHLDDAFQEAEKEPRLRHPLTTLFFDGKWNKGVSI